MLEKSLQIQLVSLNLVHISNSILYN